jgi:hypothetical protein
MGSASMGAPVPGQIDPLQQGTTRAAALSDDVVLDGSPAGIGIVQSTTDSSPRDSAEAYLPNWMIAK